MSDSADLLAFQIMAAGLPLPEREYRFCERKWRFDCAWVHEKIAVEVQGSVWSGGRHTRGKGYTEDCNKRNTATLLGWHVLYYTTQQVEDGTALAQLESVLKGGD